MRSEKVCLGAVCALLAAGTNVAFGAVLPPELQGFSITITYADGQSWTSGADDYSMVELQPMDDRMVWHVEGGSTLGTEADTSFKLDLDADPFVSSSFNLTNNLGVAQDFTVTVTLPAGPPFAQSLMSGSISGSVIDANGVGDGSISTTPGKPFYAAMVDGVTVRTMYDDPYSLGVVSAPGLDTANIPTRTFVNEPGPGLVATIGITNWFRLTPGDAGQMVSTFRIDEYVPTPGALTLMGLAGLVVVRRRR